MKDGYYWVKETPYGGWTMAYYQRGRFEICFSHAGKRRHQLFDVHPVRIEEPTNEPTPSTSESK